MALLRGVFGDGPARSGYVMFFQEGIQSGAAQTGYLAGFFNVTSRQRHQLFKILFSRFGKCCFPKRSIFRERLGNETTFALDIFCRTLFVLGQWCPCDLDSDVVREVFGENGRLILCFGQDLFYGVAQLPNIPWPVIVRKQVEKIGWKALGPYSITLA